MDITYSLAICGLFGLLSPSHFQSQLKFDGNGILLVRISSYDEVKAPRRIDGLRNGA
jgi:hypothetical protein